MKLRTISKRAVALVMMLVLLLSVLSLSGCKETTELLYELNDDGSGYFVDVDGKYVGTELIIPAEYEGLPVLGIKEGAFKKCKNLETVVIESNGQGNEDFKIGASAFEKSKALKSVTIEKTGNIDISYSAFSDCKSLSTFDIPAAESVSLDTYTFDDSGNLTVNIGGAELSMRKDSFYISDDDYSYSLNLTDCHGELYGDFASLNLVGCTFNDISGSADSLVLDNSSLTGDETFFYAKNATFRNTVAYHNNYKDSWFVKKGGIIDSLVIESIGQGSEFSQLCDDKYYPIASNITLGVGITQIPSGIFGDAPLSELGLDKLTITYGGASAAFGQLPYDVTRNGNLASGEYTLISADGKAVSVTFVDGEGRVLKTVDASVGAVIDGTDLALPNTTIAPGEIANGYWLDAEHTQAWSASSMITGDTTVYVSFVDRALLQEAELEVNDDGVIRFEKNGTTFTCITWTDDLATVEKIKESLRASELATVELFADSDCTTAAPTVIETLGLNYVYVRVTSWDKSVSNVYVLEITVKDVYYVTFTVDGQKYVERSCTEGQSIEFPKDPTKKGHTFLGWSTDGTEDGIVSKTGYIPLESHTLTAVFNQDIYTVRIEGSDLEYKVVYGQTLLLPIPELRDYYGFYGYEYDGNLVTDANFSSEGCYLYWYPFEHDVTLKHRIEPIRYGITLYDGFNYIDTIYITVEDEDVTLPTASREWYSFVGWSSNRDGSGEKITTLDTSNPAAYRDLYASFELASYTVRFMDGTEQIASQTFDYYNQTVTAPPAPQKNGYSSRWESFTVGARSFDVQVYRTPIDYTITYEGTFGSTNTNPTTYTVEDTLVFSALSREHYDFNGWLNQDGEYVAGIPEGTTGNLTLTADWSITKYTVHLITGENTEITKKVEYNTQFNLDLIDTPTEENKLFVGWYNQDYTEIISGKITVTGDVRIYAKWLDSIAITTFEDFEKLRENPSGTFHLAEDVDMRGELVSPIAEFSGILDGKGFKIYNFTLKVNSAISSFGLFNKNSGTIRDLTLDEVICSVTISPDSSTDCVGILVGTNDGTISDCSVISPNYTVTSSYAHGSSRCYINVGGLVGRNNGTIVGCSTDVDMTTHFNLSNNANYYGDYFNEIYSRIGGLVGINGGTVSNSTSVSVIHSTGNASGTGRGSSANYMYIGGLVGENESGKTIEQCYSSTNLTASATILSQGYATGSGYIGAFIGVNKGIITESYSVGSLSTDCNNTGYVGGFVGDVGASGDISNCYTTATVTSTRASDVGGFAGRISGSVQNSYSVGGISVTSGSNVAGFVGVITSGGVANKCFTTGNVSAKATNVGFFSANVSNATGIITNSYYSASASVLQDGIKLERAEENGARRDYLSGITSQAFLQGKMYFYPEHWIYTTGTPVLKWEIKTDGTSLINGTHYYCATCGGEFVNSSSSLHTTVYYDKAASCETDGIRYFGCENCGKHFAVATEAATGHSYTDDSEGKDFCNDDILVTYVCTNADCQHTYTEQFFATGHRHEHTDSCSGCGYSYKAPTCTEDGSVSFVCDDCGSQVNKVIPAEHTMEFVSWVTRPTCLTDGYGKFACTSCAANGVTSVKEDYVQNSRLGHLDLTGDGLCDRDECGMLIYDASDAIQITTVEQLLAISRDSGSGSLEKTYLLMADLDLKGVAWEPIGTQGAPFVGVFIGNGHSIRNVSLIATDLTLGYSGLFGYNGGIISDLTVSYDGYSASYDNRNITFGSIAAFNSGTINKCTVAGEISLSFLTKAEVNTPGAAASASQSVTVGLVAGVNNGFIVGCEVSATYTFAFECYAYMGEEINDLSTMFINGKYKDMVVKSNQTVLFGTVCGQNNMSVTDCTVSGTGNVYNYLAFSQFLDGAWGYLTATASHSIGTIAGNENLVGVNGNRHTSTMGCANGAGAHKPEAGNDPGNNYYSMSSQTTITVYN